MTARLKRTLLLPAILITAASCINIHIYFPEAEVRQAAEEIVGEVRPDPTEGNGPAEGSPENGQTPTSGPAPAGAPTRKETKTSSVLWSLLAPRIAVAEEKSEAKDIKIDITSPVIKKIKETLKARYPRLQPFYTKGAIGEGADGYLAARDLEGLNLKEKRDLQALLKEENDDRKNLYTEIVRSNAIGEEHLARVGELFSKEWQKKCKEGWWVETSPGTWEKKQARKK